VAGVTAVRIYTREQVEGILDDALAIVRELEITGALESAAFVKACDLLSASQILVEQAQPIPLPLGSLEAFRGR